MHIVYSYSVECSLAVVNCFGHHKVSEMKISSCVFLKYRYMRTLVVMYTTLLTCLSSYSTTRHEMISALEDRLQRIEAKLNNILEQRTIGIQLQRAHGSVMQRICYYNSSPFAFSTLQFINK